jgi:hypothetical protein
VLNYTSYDILNLCNGENTVEKITTIVADKYDTHSNMIYEDVKAFIYEAKELLWFD